MPYRPSILPPPQDGATSPLQQALTQEFKTIAEVLYSMPALYLQELSVAPAKPRQADIVFADGTNWNPGSGAGTYEYKAGAYVPLFTPATSAPNPIIASTAATSGTQVNFASIPQTYDELLFEFLFLSHNGGAAQNLQVGLSSDNGSTFQTCTVTTFSDAATTTLSAAAAPFSLFPATFLAANHANGRLIVPRYAVAEAKVITGQAHTRDVAGTTGAGTVFTGQTPAVAINYVRWQWTGGASFDNASGLIRLTGLKRSFIASLP